MDIDKIKYIIDFSKKTGIHYVLEQEDIEILEHILAERKVDKKKIEELEKAEKENEPYEQHNKESRMYWINKGKISLAKKLLEDK